MTTRHFQWTIIWLFVLVLGLLGVENFLLWNQQHDAQSRLVPEGTSQTETGSGKEASEEKSPSRPAKEAQPSGAGSARPQEKEKPDSSRKKDKQDSKSKKDDKTYEVDVAASRVYVKVGSATRIGHPHGVEGKLKSGSIHLGAGGKLVFDMTSFKTDTQEARKKVGLEKKKISTNEVKKVQKTMLSADVLDVEKFPTATCNIISIKPADRQEAGNPGTYQVNGRLSLHGAEQPLVFKAKLERGDKKGTFELSGSFTIKQTAYGIKPYSAAGGLVKVADDLEITGELVLGPAK
jgi:polyisoprenoid-binding protein YceI